MAISWYQIKRWIKMVSGNSVDHVNQNIGNLFAKNDVLGYYNNLTEKVTKQPKLLYNEELPIHITNKYERIFFPVAVFQYGLGAYDLWLQTKDHCYFRKFKLCADWALKEQDNLGRWDNFFFYMPNKPYSAMAQGEGASLLVRAYKESAEIKYLSAAIKAIDFMLKPIEDGGTTCYKDGNAYLLEYTFKGLVLNGAVFAWWGLYDLVLITGDEGKYKQAMEDTLLTLVKVLPQFNNRYWSMYSLDGLIASPFYHNLHIAQMQALYELTGLDIFDKYAKRWKKHQRNPISYICAFITKALQKIKE